MNVLLFAPAIFLAYVATGGWIRAIKQVSLCALVQLIIGFPFLATFPVEYLKGSFDIGRVFLFKWTVNWRFVPEEIFIHKSFHVTLLLLHVMALLFFSRKWWAMLQLYSRHGAVGKHIYCIVFKLKLHCLRLPDYMIYYITFCVSENLLIPLYTSNFIGMMFARSLHYQFYIWYYHQLPLLLFCTKTKEIVNLTVLGLIELCWNIYPSTNESSALLNICHLFMLYQFVHQTRDKKNSK